MVNKQDRDLLRLWFVRLIRIVEVEIGKDDLHPFDAGASECVRASEIRWILEWIAGALHFAVCLVFGTELEVARRS